MYISNTNKNDIFTSYPGDTLSYPFDCKYDNDMKWNHIMEISEEVTKAFISDLSYPHNKLPENKIAVVIDNQFGRIIAIYKHDFDFYLIQLKINLK